MALKRYLATKDNTITNAFEANLETRGTGSNMGLADSMAVFSIFGQASSDSHEASRFLVQFPITASNQGTSILKDRLAGKIPASGSVDFYLRFFNVSHGQTLPRDFTLLIEPVSQAWQEGYGLDMEEYKDQTYDGTGSNWINARAHTPWTSEGGDYLITPSYEQTFRLGTEDLEINISQLVEDWILGDVGGKFDNFGVGVRLIPQQENGNRSYYTKMFSARGSEYFFKRPIIEARWDSTRKDQRGAFYVSSSALSAEDNINTIYFYNYYRGALTNVEGVDAGDEIYVSMYERKKPFSPVFYPLTTTPQNPVTGGWVSEGIYSASFALNTTSGLVFDRWWKGVPGAAITDPGVRVYHTGTIKPIPFKSSNIFDTKEYVTAVTNLQSEYSRGEQGQFRIYTRLKGWNPTIYTVANAGIQHHIIDNIYYKVIRTIDEFEVIPYGTGSLNYTRLSYDASGSYFELNMDMFQEGFEYGIRFGFDLNNNGVLDEYNHTYKFKVIE